MTTILSVHHRSVFLDLRFHIIDSETDHEDHNIDCVRDELTRACLSAPTTGMLIPRGWMAVKTDLEEMQSDPQAARALRTKSPGLRKIDGNVEAILRDVARCQDGSR